MVSVHRVSSFNYDNRQNSAKNVDKNNSVKLNASDPNVLNNFLALMGHRNSAAISFGKNTGMKESSVQPYGKPYAFTAFSPTMSKYGIYKIKTESANRIYGKTPWPQIDKINGWMVTAETEDFLTEGGLGKVATDLPMSFNKRYNYGAHKMTVITPLYHNDNNLRLDEKDGNFTYIYGKTGEKQIPLELVGKINVPILDSNPPDESNTRLIDNEVRIFKGHLKDTDYLFLDTTDKKAKNDKGLSIKEVDMFQTSGGIYGNVGLLDATARMAYFSKSVYEAMKAAKEGRLDKIQEPNVALLNDWHAGPVASLTKYMATAEADYGQISDETGKYFAELPSIYIVHNALHQGWSKHGDELNRMAIFATLFQGFSTEILANAKTWDMQNVRMDYEYMNRLKDNYGNKWMSDSDLRNTLEGKLGNAIMTGDEYNAAMNGLSLADRVVPVSPHYAEELLESDRKANGLLPLLTERTKGPVNTLTPILNGFSKSLIAPTQDHMDGLIKDTLRRTTLGNEKTIDLENVKLQAFDEINEKTLDIKKENKNEVIGILKKIIAREQQYKRNGKYDGQREYKVENPENTYIPELANYDETPVVTYVGRIDKQKGIDSIFWGALYDFAKNKAGNIPNEKLPIFIIGGNLSPDGTYEKLVEMKDNFLKEFPEVGKRIVLVNGFVNTNMLCTASDMFLVPSVFEPCGLTQIEAMAKGALPIVTAAGGLVNSVKDGVDGFMSEVHYDDFVKGSGTLYGNEDAAPGNSEAYAKKLNQAIDMFYNDKSKFGEMQKNAMRNDFSWSKNGGAIEQYYNLMKTGVSKKVD